MVMDHMLKGGTCGTGRPAETEAGMPVVSIITVVFNSETLLERTIQSILGQTYPNIEYIIIDGGSRDGTVDIIRKYEDRIAFWISEPDKGLYDAMNKGLAAATGDFVWFLNSGDLVYEPTTLAKVFEKPTDDRRPTTDDRRPTSVIRHPSSVIYYGDTMVVDSNYHEIGLRRLRPPEQLTWKSFRKGMLVCHQAILVHRSIAEPYNLKYRYSADFDWVLNALRRAQGHGGTGAQGHKGTRAQEHGGIRNTGLILCAFLDGGQSKKTIRASLIERFDIMQRNYGLIPTVLRHVPIAVKFVWYLMMNRRF
jgi:hypothetical protein